jgi:hypothetical protein
LGFYFTVAEMTHVRDAQRYQICENTCLARPCYLPSPKFSTMSSSPFNHHVETGLPLEQDVSLQQYMDVEKEKKRHQKSMATARAAKGIIITRTSRLESRK